MEPRQRFVFQIIYGLVLMLAGVGVFFRIPQVMPEMGRIESLNASLPFIRFCFYLLGVLLIGGGIKKIHFNYKQLTSENKNSDTE
jgi:hypothetical protein